jgi:CheY-like chemotaxis protein
MIKYGPVIIVEDDEDDRVIMEEVFMEMATSFERKYFTNAQDALKYLITTNVQPFLIISDVNLPGIDGPQFKLTLNENEYLRKKSIPFVFLTTSAKRDAVEKAYEMLVQGYFEKPTKPKDIRMLFTLILEYWQICIHPNTIVERK